MSPQPDPSVIPSQSAQWDTPPKRKHRWRIWLAVALAPLYLPLIFYCFVRVTHPHAGSAKIRISTETTRLTGPLDTDGHVDYVAALNTALGSGVTRENNAAVLFWQSGAVERANSRALDDAVVAALAIDPNEKRENSYQGLYPFVKSRPELRPEYPALTELQDVSSEEAMESIDQQLAPFLVAGDWPAVHRVLIAHRHRLLGAVVDEDPTWPAFCFGQRYPWDSKTYPEAAAWLEHIEPALELLSEAAARPRYFSPLAGGDEAPYLPAVMMPDVNSMVEVSRAFSLRAMCRAGEGDIDGAWADILTIHRWARLAAQHPSLVGQLVGYVIEGKAIDLEECLFADARVTRSQLQLMLNNIQELPQFPSTASKIDGLERYMFLEIVQVSARRGGASNVLGAESIWEVYGPHTQASDWWIDKIVDWNVVLMEGNQYYDRAVAALEQPTFLQRKQACEQVQSTLAQFVRNTRRSKIAVPLSYVRGSIMEHRLAASYTGWLMPAFIDAMIAEERVRVRRQLAEMALWIAIYRADHGALPPTLSAAASHLRTPLPVDSFNGQPIRYRPSEAGYVLYSVGENAKDDGGFRPGAWRLRIKRNSDYDLVFEAPPLFQPD